MARQLAGSCLPTLTGAAPPCAALRPHRAPFCTAPAQVPGLKAEQVAAGWKHSAAITSGGRLYTWGWGGSQGEPGLPAARFCRLQPAEEGQR